MHHTLADDQISNANRYLTMVSGASLSAAEMNQLATHLQIATSVAQQESSRKLCGRMLEALKEITPRVAHPHSKHCLRLRIADEWGTLGQYDGSGCSCGISVARAVIAEAEAALSLKPAEPTMEEMESMLPIWIECWEGRIRDGKLTFDAEEAESIIKDYRNLNKALITRRTGASHDR